MSLSTAKVEGPPRPVAESSGPQRRRRPHLVMGSWWWALPAILLVFAVHYVAVGIGGTIAFTNWSGIGAFEWVGLSNFVKIFSDPLGFQPLINTLFLAAGFLIGTNVLGLGLGLALNRGLKSRYLLRALFFLPAILSPLAVSYIWRYIFQYAGPLNEVLNILGFGHLAKVWLADPSSAIWTILVVSVWQSTGLAMVIYLAGLAGIPRELEEAASLDGAGLLQRFRYIVIPGIRPSIIIATMLMLIHGLRIFDQVLALTGGGPANATETLSTQVYKQTFSNGLFGYGSALSLVLTVMVVVFALIQQAIVRQRSEVN